MATRKASAQLDGEIAIAISDRRISALRANGEDVRNTVAWRDAMHERRALNFSPASTRSPPRKREVSAGEQITLIWYAVPNANTKAGGFMPVYEHNGKLRGNPSGRGYDKETAEKMAAAMAREQAAHYVGDWNVVIKQGRHHG